jgi:hypothetical protein
MLQSWLDTTDEQRAARSADVFEPAQ